ncbi:MAG TPA: alpha/beta hydrolase [Pseudonocardia sp.]|nr:alpha/beta hydrolase [Pseudonocardia sp.]
MSRSAAPGPVGPISYLVAGPVDGPLVVFVHGWPAIAETWRPQLEAFAALGHRVVAPDMRGYGQSATPADPAAYGQRHLVDDMLALLAHLGRDSATWVGHDWGSATVWALAAHHPRACAAVASLCVPYRMLDRGLEVMLTQVNRSIYPIDRYPYAQFDYMAYYERNPERAIAVLGADPARTVAAFFRRGEPDGFGKPARTATLVRDGGWFGGADMTPNVPLAGSVLTADLYQELRRSFERTGFAGPTAYYLNHVANRAYSDESLNGGHLDMPALFIEARYDVIADTAVAPDRKNPMREHCAQLTERSVDAGHWLGLERPAEVNAALESWLSAPRLLNGAG